MNLATIRSWGTVLLGKNVLCDGEASLDAQERKIACFSHIHEDHIQGFPDCLSQFKAVLVTEETKDLLIALKGNWLELKENFISRKYNEPFKYLSLSDEQITFLDSGHILGSSQILVENEKGNRILYSSDFNLPGVNIPDNIDVLVLDSTHGDPQYNNRVDKDKAIYNIKKLVTEELGKLRPVIIKAHRGKLQYLMHLLRDEVRESIDFIAKHDDKKLAEVYTKYGLSCGNVISENSEDFTRISKRNEPFVRFYPLSGNLPCEREGVRSIRVGLNPEYNILETNMFQINFSDHACFDDILEYVRNIKPKLVITDNSLRFRNSIGITLANLIKREDINAIPSPISIRENLYE